MCPTLVFPGILSALVGVMYWRALASVGPWLEVNAWRRSPPTDPRRLHWESLSPLVKAWFYFVPHFGLVGLGLIVVGLLKTC